MHLIGGGSMGATAPVLLATTGAVPPYKISNFSPRLWTIITEFLLDAGPEMDINYMKGLVHLFRSRHYQIIRSTRSQLGPKKGRRILAPWTNQNLGMTLLHYITSWRSAFHRDKKLYTKTRNATQLIAVPRVSAKAWLCLLLNTCWAVTKRLTNTIK